MTAWARDTEAFRPCSSSAMSVIRACEKIPPNPLTQIAEQACEWPALRLCECTRARALLAKCQGMAPGLERTRPIDERRHATQGRRPVGACNRRGIAHDDGRPPELALRRWPTGDGPCRRGPPARAG